MRTFNIITQCVLLGQFVDKLIKTHSVNNNVKSVAICVDI